MKIQPLAITVSELLAGYVDNGEGGVRGYRGRLDIRPPYQREFIYKDKEQEAVISTLKSGFPLNVMYWVKRNDGTFEVLDGQQRTIAIGKYLTGKFPHEGSFFHSEPDDIQARIRDYELQVYVCEGSDSEKLAWFRTINIAGQTLTDQEIRNAMYVGPWLADAKRYFSRRVGGAYQKGKDLIRKRLERQEYLELAIKWHKQEDQSIEQYMSQHQHQSDAEDLWLHFQAVIDWADATFTKKRAEMKSVDWGSLYREHSHRDDLDPVFLENEVSRLFTEEEDEVQNLAGIYSYLLDGKERHLNLRAFTSNQKAKMYERQGGKCAITGESLPIEEMEADHITPWIEGGKTTLENGQMISREENRRKGVR